jgi:hypothetical protein
VTPSSFKVRGVLPDDVEFILKTWTREIERTKPRRADGSSAFPKRLFFDQYQRDVIVPLMTKAYGRVVVPVDDVSLIACFVVGNVIPEARTSVVHFAYTRPPFRRLGLAKAALEDLDHVDGYELVATHWTRYLNRFERADLVYNDLVLYHV